MKRSYRLQYTASEEMYNEKDNLDFLYHLEKSLLLALQERKTLSFTQCSEALDRLGKRYKNMKKEHI